MSAVAKPEDPSPILACTVSRDVQDFELLIDEMEAEFGEAWGDLLLHEALAFLDQPDAAQLEVLALALSDSDSGDIDLVLKIVEKARSLSIGVLLIADELDPLVLHKVLQSGANEFLPYPMPEASLSEAVERLSAPPPSNLMAIATEGMEPDAADGTPDMPSRVSRDCTMFAVQGLAGGVGATTFALNLAWELATMKGESPRVLLLDMDQQFGAVATYLDLPRRDNIYELVSDVENLDEESFKQALQVVDSTLSVFTAPADILPLDMLSPDEMEHLLTTASSLFDYIVIDMPSALVGWTETVLRITSVYFGLVELDMRSAQNTLRFIKTLKAEDLPVEKLRYVLNKSPKLTDLTGKARVKRMADSLDISFGEQMPDGGRHVSEACDHGTPLAKRAAKNPLRKELAKLAKSLHEISVGAAEAAK